MYNNPYFTNLRKPATQDFRTDPRFQMPNMPGGPIPKFDGYAPKEGMDFSGMLGAASDGYAAGVAGGTAGNFSMNSGGIAGAAGSGLAKGFATGGPLGAAIGGTVGAVTSIFKQDRDLKNQINNVQTNFTASTDMYGRPVYSGGELSQGLQNLNSMQDGLADSKEGKIGLQLGKKGIRPKRRKQLQNKIAELQKGILSAQQNYNTSEASYRDQMNQREDYLDRLRR